jgi:protein-tyrosine phosphatase
MTPARRLDRFASTSLAIAFAACVCAPTHARVADASVERTVQGQLVIHWQDNAPVDVIEGDMPDPAKGKLVARAIAKGTFQMSAPPHARHYFFLKDTRDKTVVTVAERVLPLDQGSNFRDLGGYPAASGKTVRWGLLFRSGATPLLTEPDQAEIARLGLQQMIDLRSSEERQLAPSRITGVPYTAVDYSFGAIMPKGAFSPETGYPAMIDLLDPQLKLLFATLLRKQAPVVTNCSAGQDRTGIASAILLSALGVPRDAIIKDYLLSPQFRHPENEMPAVDLAQFPGNAAAAMFAHYRPADGKPVPKPTPLLTADGTPFLMFAFAEIDRRWGSMDSYLEKQLGIGPAERAQLRRDYLE